ALSLGKPATRVSENAGTRIRRSQVSSPPSVEHEPLLTRVLRSTLHGTDMDLSQSLGAVPHPTRLRCLSANCQKTVSSASNRNKHMREGCQYREKTGYRCRNEHCPKVLTTKWYRNTHEAERCRYRGITGQGAGDKGG